KVNLGLILALVQKATPTGDDPLRDLDALIDASHSTEKVKTQLKDQGRQILAQLLAADVVIEDELGLAVHEDLQDDFALHHALSLFLVDLVGKLDRASPTYALDVLTCVEAILEHPKPV